MTFMSDHSKFVKGAAILGIAGIVVKLLGAVYRIPLIDMISNEGISYYQTAYPIYVLLLTIATTGLPVAIAKMISEKVTLGDHLNADRIFKTTASLMIGFGALSAGLVYFFAEDWVHRINNENAYYALIALVPALFAAPILSALRGFFQGRQNMLPTAVSQIVEQLVRVFAGLSLAHVFLPQGLPRAAGGASLGGAMGTVVAVLVMLYFYFRRRTETRQEILKSTVDVKLSIRQILRELLYIAVPITLGASIVPLMDSIDASLFPMRLQHAGFSILQANELHGNLKGLAQTVINFPLVFLGAISVSLVPSIAEYNTKRNMEKKENLIHSGLRLSFLISLPCAVGIFVLAHPIMNLLYSKQSAETLMSAGNLLMVSSFQLIFLGVVQSMGAVLMGLGYPGTSAMNMFAGAVAKVILSYVLMGISSINIYGMVLSSLICYVIAAVLDIYFVIRLTKIRLDFTTILIKPFLSALLMGGVVFFVYRGLSFILGGKVSTLVSVLAGVLVYASGLLIFKAVKKEDFTMLPKGERVYQLLEKKGWVD